MPAFHMPRLLWQHKDPTSTRMYEFKTLLEKQHDVKLDTYRDLHQWSVDNIGKFWEHVWEFTGIVASAPFTQVSLS